MQGQYKRQNTIKLIALAGVKWTTLVEAIILFDIAELVTPLNIAIEDTITYFATMPEISALTAREDEKPSG